MSAVIDAPAYYRPPASPVTLRSAYYDDGLVFDDDTWYWYFAPGAGQLLLANIHGDDISHHYRQPGWAAWWKNIASCRWKVGDFTHSTSTHYRVASNID